MTTNRSEKYRGNADPAVSALTMQLIEAETALAEKVEEDSAASRAARTAHTALLQAQEKVERLVDALDVLAGEPGIRVERRRRVQVQA